MNELPWFKLWVEDWINSTKIPELTLEQEAIYMRLLIRQWMANDGFLSTNQNALANWTRLDARRWNAVGKPILDKFFVRENGHYVNRKLREQWEEAQKVVNAMKRGGKRGARQRWGN